MTFLSPSFLFVFLPIALSVYSLVPKYLKSYSLPLIGCLFYAAVNLKNIFALIAMPCIILAVTLSVELYRRRRDRLGLNLCRVGAMLAIFGLLASRVSNGGDLLSGVGVFVCLATAVSLCSDVLKGKGRVPDTAWDVVIYMTFFPIILVGPIIKYGDFVEKMDRLNYSIDNFSSGAVRCMVGAVKCIAISAVLGEAYSSFALVIGDSLSLLSAALLMVVNCIRIYYFLSGCSDIAVGLASMFGVRLERDFGGCFSSVTPCEYIRNFSQSLLDFCRSYITVPVSEIVTGLSGNIVAAVFAALFYALIFSTNIETMYTVMIPLSIAMLLIVFRTGKKRKKVAAVPRTLGRTATFFVAAAFFWYVSLGGPDGFARMIDTATRSAAFYIPPRAFAVMGDPKYVILPLAASAGCALVTRLFRRTDEYLDSMQSEVNEIGQEHIAPVDSAIGITLKYVAAALLMIAFCFVMIILLPQYPELASMSYFFSFI